MGENYYDADNIDQTMSILKKSDINNVIISGGEPLLHPQFFQIIHDLKSNGFGIDLCTNATLLNDETILKLKDYLTEISVSLDGYTRERHEKMRLVQGCFDKTVENVLKLIKAGIEVHVTTVVDADFVTEIEKMTDFLYGLGIRSVSYLGLIPINSGENRLLQEPYQEILNEQVCNSRRKYPDMEINTKQLLKNSAMCSCGAGKMVYGLGTDGLSLVPCLLLRDRNGKTRSNRSEGMCPGSKYLTSKGE